MLLSGTFKTHKRWRWKIGQRDFSIPSQSRSRTEKENDEVIDVTNLPGLIIAISFDKNVQKL